MKATTRKELFGTQFTKVEEKAFDRIFPDALFNDLDGFKAQMEVIVRALEIKKDNLAKGQVRSGLDILNQAVKEKPVVKSTGPRKYIVEEVK
jgi:hypothetical protein